MIGLYMNPPQHAAVFAADEKTSIQALDRLDPMLPLSPGRAERHGFEYYRHRTLSLFAALDTRSGELWFAKFERDLLARGIFTSVSDLVRKIRRYIRHYNRPPSRSAGAIETQRIELVVRQAIQAARLT